MRALQQCKAFYLRIFKYLEKTWEFYNLNFIDGKLRTHSGRVIFSMMQNNLGHNDVNTRADLSCCQDSYSTLLLTCTSSLGWQSRKQTQQRNNCSVS